MQDFQKTKKNLENKGETEKNVRIPSSQFPKLLTKSQKLRSVIVGINRHQPADSDCNSVFCRHGGYMTPYL